FRREARAAAGLHHTNIVPVFGVGEADGSHYLVMQLIQGQPLDQVLAELRRLRRPGAAPDPAPSQAASVAHALLTGQFPNVAPTQPAEATPPPARPPAAHTESSVLTDPGGRYWQGVARIGVQVAEALAYAHQQGVVHRDVKPSNLLLDAQGTAWVADFGLAKGADSADLTGSGEVVGTLR